MKVVTDYLNNSAKSQTSQNTEPKNNGLEK